MDVLRSLYNNIKPPSWLGASTDFHLFKQGIQPKWEDPQCEHGGKWTILVPRGNKQILDKFWLHSVSSCLPSGCVGNWRLTNRGSPRSPALQWLLRVAVLRPDISSPTLGSRRSNPSCGQNMTGVIPIFILRMIHLDVVLHLLPQLLACIGEQFDEGQEICGVVVNMRQKQDKVCLWTKTASNEAVQVSVGKQFKEFLEFDAACGFLAHVSIPCLSPCPQVHAVFNWHNRI